MHTALSKLCTDSLLELGRIDVLHPDLSVNSRYLITLLMSVRFAA